MTLHLNTIPGFADVPDSVLEADDPASAVALSRIGQNAAFGMVRLEFFSGIYADGDTVPLPVSPVDGYAYSREELSYSWGLYSTFNKDSHWITGPDSLWYAAWLVEQDTGKVFSSEYYRRSSNTHPNGQKSNDGQLLVYTYAQRLKTLAISVPLSGIPELDTTNTVVGGNASPLSTILKIVSPAGSYNRARISVKAAQIAGQGLYIYAGSLMKTPTGVPTTILETVPITWNGGSSTLTSLIDGQVIDSDPIEMVVSQGFDYYAVVVSDDTPWHGGGTVSRGYWTPSHSGHENPSPQLCLLNGDFSTGTSGGSDLSDFDGAYPYWTLISSFRLTNAPSFSSPDDFEVLADEEFYQDRPLNTGLVTSISRNAKYACFNTEVIYMGEYIDGDVVGKPVSPYDGHVYEYANVIFMHSWRWTTTGASFTQPNLSLGQLDRLNALVDGTGNVDLDVQYYPAHGGSPSTSGHGRIIVVAFCTRGGIVDGSGS